MSSEQSTSPTLLQHSFPSSVVQRSPAEETLAPTSDTPVLNHAQSLFNVENGSTDKISSSFSEAKTQERTSSFGLLIKQLAEQTKTSGHFKLRQDAPHVTAAPRSLESTCEKHDQLDVTVLKRQLELARTKIVEMGHELTQQRQAPKLLGQSLNDPSGLHHRCPTLSEQGTLGPEPTIPETSWASSEILGASMDVHALGDGPGQWSAPLTAPTVLGWNRLSSAGSGRPLDAPQPQRPRHFSGRAETGTQAQGHSSHARGAAQFGNAWSPFSTTPQGVSPPVTPLPYFDGNGLSSPFPTRTFGNLLPPYSADSVCGAGKAGPAVNNPWNVNVSLKRIQSVENPHRSVENLGKAVLTSSQPSQLNPNAQHYIPPVEPINYRRLLDRSMSCNWRYIVDKIVCNNDQQASIFLQQKLKVSTQEQKFELVEAIISQAYPLMINRFGNFLIQRCFEHGTPEQVIAIANSIRGKTLDLSMDAFGCHVVQKAFDVVPEEYKALMVHELLRRIPETVVHRYACHVWQKLFELRWSESPPQIMKYVNESLKGMWHEVALGETGSLVVQNIFENCLEEDKRPCIEDVLSSIDIVSHGQFGNWCIQHICEHGDPTDKCRAIDHVLRFTTEYSTDQFASKVVEKCLKVGGSDFLDRYLEKVCEGRSDRPRMPLIDIAGDQYGNYLIQYILTNAELHHRELVAQHVRKHMVSLRGSKFGSRVAMLCTNPAVQTRPGPPSTAPVPNAPYYAGGGHIHGNYNSRMSFGMGRQDFR